MKVKTIKVKNFRGYKNETKVRFDNMTLIVGKNDIGKSTILEAADIFFGNRKPDSDDLNIHCDKDTEKIEISIEFSDLPTTIDIDAGAETSLSDEYLLNQSGNLEVKKIFTTGSTAQPKVFLRVKMPQGADVLVTLKNAELKTKAESLGIDSTTYSASINNSIRKAIWGTFPAETFEEVEIDINKEDGKKIYEKLELLFPIFTLFSVDRENTDQDSEIQSPVKASIKELVATLHAEFEPIRIKILGELDKISDGTIKKLEEMNPEVAKTLKAIADKPAWEKAFTVNIESDGVPLNKRGSGVKRLILINFFRQEAERRRNKENRTTVFYAIEEPETSQHPDWQIKLFEAFRELTVDDGVQIALTSHHPELCGLVNLENVRFIQKIDEEITIKEGDETNYKEISKTLGVLPKLEGVKVVVGVEGPNDVEFFKNVSAIFGVDGNDSKILWIPMGGGTLRDYVDKSYLDLLNLPQVHFFDRDSDSKYLDNVSSLKTKGHWAELTRFLTLENYIHPRLYKTIWSDLRGNFIDASTDSWLDGWEEKNIPNELSAFIDTEFVGGNTSLKKYNSGNVKSSCAFVAKEMTEADFKEMGTYDEIRVFFGEIQKHL